MTTFLSPPFFPRTRRFTNPPFFPFFFLATIANSRRCDAAVPPGNPEHLPERKRLTPSFSFFLTRRGQEEDSLLLFSFPLGND